MKLLTHETLLLLITIVALTSCSDQARSNDLSAVLDNHLTQVVAEGGFQGSLAVVLSGTVIASRSFGLANLEHEVPNSSFTKYRIGSVTKHMVATAILMLQDRGQLEVTDLVADYIPDLPHAWSEIRIHHLLNHTAGLANLTDLPGWRARVSSPSSLRQEAEWYWETSLLFEPGQKFRYSNAGYVLACLIVEQVSGLAYEVFLRTEVFDRTRLTETGFSKRDHDVPNMASGYFLDDEQLTLAPSFFGAVGGNTYSTVGDMIKWGNALRDGGLLSETSYVSLTTPEERADSAGNPNTYAYGLFVRDMAGTKVLSHGGWVPGFNAFLLVAPEKELCVVVMSNVTHTVLSPPAISARIASELASLVLTFEAR